MLVALEKGKEQMNHHATLFLGMAKGRRGERLAERIIEAPEIALLDEASPSRSMEPRPACRLGHTGFYTVYGSTQADCAQTPRPYSDSLEIVLMAPKQQLHIRLVLFSLGVINWLVATV
jgi:hypothetical protein